MVSHENAGAARPRHTVGRALIGAALLSSPCIVALAAPSLSGSPATSVTAAHYYAFQPAAGHGGKKLTFSITNKPSWAQFDPASGRLYGTPLPQTNVGKFANISISASDGACLAPFSITVLPLPNTPPRISGTPAAAVAVGGAYSFQPAASDPNGLRLAFAITNKPAWASFNTVTGGLSGTPTAANAGTYPNITITVYDGYQKAVLPAFSIAVQNSTAGGTPPAKPPVTSPPAGGSQTTGAATLVWQPPTQTTSGGTLTNLAGYHIYYGTTPNNLAQSVNVANPGVTRFVIGGLTAATWYFQMTAYDRNGIESPPTGIESFVLQ
jgi:Putative Ig domain